MNTPGNRGARLPEDVFLLDKARSFGASDAVFVSADMISVEDRIISFCRPPQCEGYGRSIYCPPHAMKPAEARSWISEFRRGILFKLDVPIAELMTGERFSFFRKIFEISADLEELCKAHGHVRSKSLAAGSCKPVFCEDNPCRALEPKGTCRFPRLARPSMEAVGINVFDLAEKVGWEMHPITRNTREGKVARGLLAGLTLLG